MSNKINFFLEETTFPIKKKGLLRRWISESISLEGFVSGNINVILCSDEYLHKMNIEYLNHDTFTDIITFDYSENKIISGDLFISIDRIKENASIFSKKVIDELHRVIIHGVLHLCKFGDKTKLEKEVMTQKENAYLLLRPDKLRVS